MSTVDPRRTLPSVDVVLNTPRIAELLATIPRPLVVSAIRDVLAERRSQGRTADGIDEDIVAALAPTLRPVINATGVILHTNLGRAPLAPAAIDAAIAAAGYSSVEWDTTTGTRGSRQAHVQRALRQLTGAEAACVVTTNAGAVLLALVALGGGGEVIVSRGELVEIGGGFRVPEVLEASGCRLVEVGTTNKTRIEDYANAIGARTRAILRVHPSNYRVVGFTEATPLDDLVQLAVRHELTVIDDLGSGALDGDWIFHGEPDARSAVAAGVGVAAFSGDKLLGGPQCGILVGQRDLIARCSGHPLMRAMRPDKMILAALLATLNLHHDPATRRQIPALARLADQPDVRRGRAERLAAAIPRSTVVPTVGRVGGGSLPLVELASYAVVLPAVDGPEIGAARLRALQTPIAARIVDDKLLLDVLALDDQAVDQLARLVPHAL